MENKSSVEWFANRISHGGLVSKKQFDELLEQAKVIEKNQRRKDFVNGYKERAKLSGKVFDEISEAVANKLFEKQEQ